MQQLDGFQFATVLDLNMGYYTIQLDAESKDITTIVTEFGKFRYNMLPMGLVSSGNIFQAKVNELLGDIEGVKAYIDDILVLISGTWAVPSSASVGAWAAGDYHTCRLNRFLFGFTSGVTPTMYYMLSKKSLPSYHPTDKKKNARPRLSSQDREKHAHTNNVAERLHHGICPFDKVNK